MAYSYKAKTIGELIAILQQFPPGCLWIADDDGDLQVYSSNYADFIALIKPE